VRGSSHALYIGASRPESVVARDGGSRDWLSPSRQFAGLQIATPCVCRFCQSSWVEVGLRASKPPRFLQARGGPLVIAERRKRCVSPANIVGFAVSSLPSLVTTDVRASQEVLREVVRCETCPCVAQSPLRCAATPTSHGAPGRLTAGFKLNFRIGFSDQAPHCKLTRVQLAPAMSFPTRMAKAHISLCWRNMGLCRICVGACG
jgi:hypothetical protein